MPGGKSQSGCPGSSLESSLTVMLTSGLLPAPLKPKASALREPSSLLRPQAPTPGSGLLGNQYRLFLAHSG